ncbi:MAG: DoxX family protein [Gemmataceae bacterium]|nr:DoxX family protein [Gemmataceae bacterium]MDW8263699.1 DoxX family protein [Gemmataceae bacterium]
MKNIASPLLLRLVLAAVFVNAGVQKVTGDGTEWGANWASRMAQPPNTAVQLAVAWGELLGGLALLLGFLTRLAVLGLAIIMGGAIYLVHSPQGLRTPLTEYQLPLTLLVICISLMLTGGGTLSIDHLLFGTGPAKAR